MLQPLNRDPRASLAAAAAAGLLDTATYSPQVRDAVDVLIAQLDRLDDSATERMKSALARAAIERMTAERRGLRQGPALRRGRA